MFKLIENRPLFNANFIATSVLAIDYKYLNSIGIEALAFDVDGTLTKRGSKNIDSNLATELIKLLNEAGINKCYIATNSNRDMSIILRELSGFNHINSKGRLPKPFKNYYSNLQSIIGLPPEKIIMIGDRWLQDIWGANNSGLKTVYVCLDPSLVSIKDKLSLRHRWQPMLVKQ